MGKRVIAVGRIDRRAQRSHIIVRAGNVVSVERRDGNVKTGYNFTVPKEDS
jgi:hypothetical protein